MNEPTSVVSSWSTTFACILPEDSRSIRPGASWSAASPGTSDDADREQLYRLLEEQVVPTYTDDRGRWIWMMKESIAQLAPRFSMHRAVIEYVDRYYLPAHARTHVGR